MPGGGMFLTPNLLCGFIAIHLRHFTIHQHGIVGGVCNGVHCLSPVPRHFHLASKLLEKFAGHNLIDLIVVDDKNSERSAAVRQRGNGRIYSMSISGPLIAGNRRVVYEKALPFPGVLSTAMAPPMSSTSWRQIIKPNPVPPYRLAVDTFA
jgi:hypothetical protein